MECRIGLLESCSIIIEAAERGSNLIERYQAPLASILWTGSRPDPSVLSARLKGLESSAVIASRNYAEHPPRLEYFLTPKGRELGPILLALKKWGEKHA
jgi:hypothetical protein